MRQIITACALAIAITGVAQTPYTRDQVVEVDTVTTAEVLRAKARKWFVDTFKDANAVIQMDDAATNTIVGKGWQELTAHDKMLISVEVACKQGRCRMKVYDVTHRWKNEASTLHWGALYDEDLCYTPIKLPVMSQREAEKQTQKNCTKYRPMVDRNLDRLVQSFTTAMQAPSDGDDW